MTKFKVGQIVRHPSWDDRYMYKILQIKNRNSSIISDGELLLDGNVLYRNTFLLDDDWIIYKPGPETHLPDFL